MRSSQKKTLLEKIERYKNAAIADSWKGACSEDEDDYESLVEDLASAENNLLTYINTLISEAP